MEASTTTHDDVRDVPFEEAVAEESIDQPVSRPRPGGQTQEQQPAQAAEPVPAPQLSPEEIEATEQAKASTEEDLAALAPKTGAQQRHFGTGENRKVFIQRELSVIGKTQWFSLVGEILDKAFSGDNKLSINSLLETPTPRTPGSFAVQDFQDADMFVHAVSKLLVHSEEFLTKSVCIWLAVPDFDWEYVSILMKQSPDEGGMSDDDFEDIFGTFVDQNYPSIVRFFRDRFPRLRARLQARQKELDQSRSQKR